MRRTITALSALALLAVPSALAAQDMADVCSDLREIEPGEWAEYDLQTAQGAGTIRLAMLDEGAGGEEGPWVEMSGDFQGQSSVIQLRVDTYPYEPADVQAVVMKMPGQPAMRLPDQMLTQMRGQMSSPVGDITEACEESELVGTESVEVPAGRFDALHIRPPAGMADATSDGDVWISTAVPFGLVKTSSDEGSMVLTGSGSDATSSITEALTAMPGMGGMGGP